MRSASVLAIAAWLLCGAWSCDPYTHLPHQLTRAAYSEASGMLVMIATNPDRVYVYDPVTRAEWSLALPSYARCVAISRDGRLAAIGHDYAVSILGIETHGIVMLPTSIIVSTLVFSADGRYAYAANSYGFYDPVRALDVVTGAETRETTTPYLNGAIESLTLHPNGRDLYAGTRDEGVHFQVSGPSIEFVRETGTGYVPGRVAFSADGTRLVSDIGAIALPTNDAATDMRFAGSLDQAARPWGFADALGSEYALAISGIDGRTLRAYRKPYFDDAGGISMPPSSVPDANPSYARAVFLDGARRFYIVLLASNRIGETLVRSALLRPNRFEPPPHVPVAAQAFLTVDAEIVDAEYSDALDRIVFVSAHPAALHALDPESGDDRVVPLPLPPLGVSVGPDSTQAAVAHGGWMTLVDLENGAPIETYPVANAAGDVVLADNGWAYSFSGRGRDRGDWMRSLDLASGLDHPTLVGNSIRGGIRGRLQPGSPRIYGMDPWLSSREIDRFEIDAGVILFTRFRDQTCIANEDGLGNLWMAEDGARLFTACGNAYRLSDDSNVDMLPDGSLEGRIRIRHLDHSSAAGRIAAVPAPPPYGTDPNADGIVELFGEDLQQRDVFALPAFEAGGTLALPHGRFAFFGAAGTRLHVLLQAGESENAFGVVSFDVP